MVDVEVTESLENPATEIGGSGFATSGSICVKITNTAHTIYTREEIQHELDRGNLFGIAET